MDTSRRDRANVFSGGKDRDSDLHRVAQDDYLEARNIRNGYGTTLGRVENVLGNRLCDNPDIDFFSRVIGAVEDKQNNTIVFFVKGGTTDGVYRWYPDDTGVDPCGRIERIMKDDALEFDVDALIHSADVIDGNLLYFVDGALYDDRSVPEGTNPKKINMSQSSLYQKNTEYHLIFDPISFDAGTTYDFDVVDIDGSPINSVSYTVPVGPPTVDAIITALAAALASINITLTLDVSATIKTPLFARVRHDDVERLIRFSGHPAQLVSINHYPENFTSQHIAIIKPTPKCPPRPRYEVDAATVGDNQVFGSAFQFRYRYYFNDGERSKWGPISYVPTNFSPRPDQTPGSNYEVWNDKEYNKIIVEFNDGLISDPVWKTWIRKVELAVRIDFNAPWRSVDVYNVDELGTTVHEVEFFNDGNYTVVPSDENGDADAQNLGNYDFVPRKSMSIEQIVDERGNTILAFLGNLEDYNLDQDGIPPVQADLSIVTSPQLSPYPASQTTQFKSLKSGGAYTVGVVYEDDFGRQSADQLLGRVKVPWGLVGDPYFLEVDFLTPPPSWATRFRITLSENQNQLRYFQLPFKEMNYWKIDRTDDTGTTTTYAAGDATHVGFSFNPNDLENEVVFNNVFFDYQAELDKVFLPANKDRMHIMNWAVVPAGGLLIGNIEQYDFPIAGYNLTDNLFNVTIAAAVPYAE